MKVNKAFFVNENRSIVELIKYELEYDKVNMLMQQEGINIPSGKIVKSDITKINEFDNVFLASENTDTLVYWSSKTKELFIMANEYSQLLFKYTEEVDSPAQIKSIIETALTPNKTWEIYEIIR